MLATKISGKGKGKGRAVEMEVDDDDDNPNGGGARKEKEGRGVIVLGKGSYLSVFDTFRNVAPIMDAILVDTDGSGQVSTSIRTIILHISSFYGCLKASDYNLLWRTQHGVFARCKGWG
jgi:hypothetical protein